MVSKEELFWEEINKLSSLDIKTSFDYDIEKCGTGGRIWKSSVLLSAYIINQIPHEIAGKTILELGSGTGVCGFVCATLGAKKVYVSDRDPGVLELLQHNKEQNKDKLNSTVEIVSLDWTRREDYESIGESLDLIIGSDVVYSLSMIEGLLNVLNYFCKDETNVLITFQKRSDELDKLIEELRKTFVVEFLDYQFKEEFSFIKLASLKKIK
jgi:predicted nicotinamide N-methyase